ncbi:hypothetical protein IQ249_21755 [Lusitaniella coriacea LEGE 07157]|uniref:Uncharacterized protein n=1 Tax=Lusitaniella coriacea LEGE 07157 TaxID=945747 RepID=A0A8J7J682_9CYAN|nr:hypothetical protein [Lusitaniella coriacea]MBE9118519.1 hypothetical protein [Lusitaniella coriacea LEGE 07157]
MRPRKLSDSGIPSGNANAKYSPVPPQGNFDSPIAFDARYQETVPNKPTYYIHDRKHGAMPEQTRRAVRQGTPVHHEGMTYGRIVKKDRNNPDSPFVLKPIAQLTGQGYVPLDRIPPTSEVPQWQYPRPLASDKQVINQLWNKPVTEWRVNRQLNTSNPADTCTPLVGVELMETGLLVAQGFYKTILHSTCWSRINGNNF